MSEYDQSGTFKDNGNIYKTENQSLDSSNTSIYGNFTESIVQRASINQNSFATEDILQLQSTIGNSAVAQLLNDMNPDNPPVNKTGMPDETKAKMENAFGTDFSDVRIHTDSQKASGLNALAYTQGSEIHFAQGKYQPDSREGQELLGHELTHVIQQKQGRVAPILQKKGDVPLNNDPFLENEADLFGKKASNGESVEKYSNSSLNSAPTGQMKAIQRKVGFEFELGIPVRTRDGEKVTNKTEVGAWKGTKFEVDNSTQLAELSDGKMSCIEMVTPAFEDTFQNVDEAVQYVETLGAIAEGMKERIIQAYRAAKSGVYNEEQPDSLVRREQPDDEIIKDIPTLIPCNPEISDVMTRHELIYPDYRLGFLSTDLDNDIAKVSTDAGVQSTVGVDLEHVDELFDLAQDDALIKGTYGIDEKSHMPERNKGLSSYIIGMFEMSKDASASIKKEIKRLDTRAGSFNNLYGLISIISLYLISGKFFNQAQHLLKNFSPIISRSDLGEVAAYALSNEEKAFLDKYFDPVFNIILKHCQRKAGEQLFQREMHGEGEEETFLDVPGVDLTCGQVVGHILSRKSDPVMAAIMDQDHRLSGSGMGTVISVRNEEVGPVRDKKDTSPKGAHDRRIGPAMELRALQPVSRFLPVSGWGAFARKMLEGMKNINSERKRGCFITTACVEARGLPDDCYELTMLREFRDGYMKSMPGGQGMIREYYDIAPRIVNRIKEKTEYKQILDDLYNDLVIKSIRLIEEGKNEEALKNYKSIVLELKSIYLPAV